MRHAFQIQARKSTFKEVGYYRLQKANVLGRTLESEGIAFLIQAYVDRSLNAYSSLGIFPSSKPKTFTPPNLTCVVITVKEEPFEFLTSPSRAHFVVDLHLFVPCVEPQLVVP